MGMITLDEKTIAELRELVSTTPTGIGGKLALALLDERAEMQKKLDARDTYITEYKAGVAENSIDIGRQMSEMQAEIERLRAYKEMSDGTLALKLERIEKLEGAIREMDAAAGPEGTKWTVKVHAIAREALEK